MEFKKKKEKTEKERIYQILCSLTHIIINRRLWEHWL